jgi:DNA end-binding protein Ku
MDPVYFQMPYYIAPRDEVGQEAFAVIRDAMRGKEVVAMGRVVLARRERPLIIEPLARGLRGTTLRFAHEIRDAADYFAGIPEVRLPEEMLRIAEHIVETRTGEFDCTYLEDRYRTVMIAKLKAKQAAQPVQAPVIAPARENITDLMDALKRSLGAEKMPPKPSVRRSGSNASNFKRTPR